MPLLILADQVQWIMLTNVLKIASTHQDKNDEMDAVSLYSSKKCSHMEISRL